jgi:hypothetical protein
MPQVARHRGNTGTDKGRLSAQNRRGAFRSLALPRRAVPHESVARSAQHHALLVARSIKMLDVILLAIGLGFFALSVGYTIACDRL